MDKIMDKVNEFIRCICFNAELIGTGIFLLLIVGIISFMMLVSYRVLQVKTIPSDELTTLKSNLIVKGYAEYNKTNGIWQLK